MYIFITPLLLLSFNIKTNSFTFFIKPIQSPFIITFVLFLLYSRTFPVIAQAEVKTILKTSGDTYKKNRDKK